MDLTLVSKNLVERGYSVKTFETAKECSDYLNSQIDATTVGIGGSVTVSELGLYPLLKEDNTVFWNGDKHRSLYFLSKCYEQRRSYNKHRR